MQPDRVSVGVLIDGWDVSPVVVWQQTSFQVVGAAQPGTCTIVLREPKNAHETSLVGLARAGANIQLHLDGELSWQGYCFTVESGYAFSADAGDRRWTISGVDLNILFDKLILWNHEHPTRSLDGAGTYQRVKTQGGYIVTVPQHTYDREYIQAMLKDTDITLISPTINTTSQVSQVGQINPDGAFAPPTPGLTLRAFMQDVSANVQRSTPGSTIWYISPAGYLVYKEQDTDSAPFSVGDDETIAGAYNVRNLRVTTDISRIKNDVLVFTGNLNPSATSTQSQLLYRHRTEPTSIDLYGRFQYSEVLSSSWLQGSVNARANKILVQEGQAAMRAEFSVFKAGLYPGQLITIHSSAHLITWYDPALQTVVATHDVLMPIRAIDINFLQQDVVEYRVTCSFDTQDPWGLLLALKRPPTRGLVQPSFKIIDLTTGGTAEPADTYTLVKEYPRKLSGDRWQCSYAYIRFSMVVYVNGLRKVSVPEEGTTVGFKETDPDNGIFFMDTAGKAYVEYHVWHNLDNQ